MAKKKKGGLGVNALVAKFKKKWGEDKVITASEFSREPLPRISTGNFGLDVATYGGIPRGRISRFWGREKSTKSGSAVNVCIEWQKHCAICYEKNCSCKDRSPANCIYIDTESKFDEAWALRHGLDPDHFLLVTPDSGNQAVDMAHAVITDYEAGFGLVVVDSIAHLTPFQELEKAAEAGETMGRGAKLVNSALRKWVAAIAAAPRGKKPTLLLINQTREKTGVMFGSPETMPMGLGQNFATSLDVKFHGKKYYYRKESGGEVKYLEKGTNERSVPSYQEIGYRVTAASCCLKGRYGVYDYWLQEHDGHRIGDPGNIDQLWRYAGSLGLITKPDQRKMAYQVAVPEDFDPKNPKGFVIQEAVSGGKPAMQKLFYEDADLQDKVREVMLNHLMQA